MTSTTAPIQTVHSVSSPLADIRWSRVEWLLLVLLPIAAYLLMNFKPVAQNGFLDPYIYTAYINNFHDLYARYGTTYYGVRFGLVLPAQAFVAVFGSWAGYFAFRYALILAASVPFYALIRQQYGRTAAVAMLVALATSPYLARALLWDYPDGAGVAYMLGSLALLQLEHRRRRLLDFGAGVLGALAIHSNFFTIAPLGVYVATYATVWLVWRRGAVALFGRAAAFTLGLLLVTGAGSAYYWWAVGQWDIFSITIDAALWLASGGTKNWRTDGAAWVLVHWAILTPLLLLLLAAIGGVRRRPFVEQTSFFGGVMTALFFYYNQFAMDGNSLELFYYFSYCLPAIFFLLALVVGRLAQGAAATWTGLVFLVAALSPWVLYAQGVTAFATWTIAHHLILAGLTGVSLAVVRRWRAVPVTAAVAAALIGLLLWSSFSRQVYASQIGNWSRPDHREREVYDVSLQFMRAVRATATRSEGHIRFWYSNLPPSNAMQSIQSTFLWGYSKVQGDGRGLPFLEGKEREFITAPDVAWLGLLAERAGQLSEAHETLRREGIRFRITSTQELASGSYRVHFQMLRLLKE